MHRILFALVFALLLAAPPTLAQETPTPPSPGVAHSPAQTAASFTLADRHCAGADGVHWLRRRH